MTPEQVDHLSCLVFSSTPSHPPTTTTTVRPTYWLPVDLIFNLYTSFLPAKITGIVSMRYICDFLGCLCLVELGGFIIRMLSLPRPIAKALPASASLYLATLCRKSRRPSSHRKTETLLHCIYARLKPLSEL